MNKKLARILIFFSVVVVGCLILLVKGKPTAKDSNPLAAFNENQISKITLINSGQNVTLEKKEDDWFVVAPLQDTADPKKLDRLVDRLYNMEIGSIVSTKREKYKNFHLQEEKAKTVEVFTTDLNKPTLKGFFGKNAMGYSSVYFRFDGEDAVYIAKGMPSYELNRVPRDYRMKELIPADFEKVDGYQILGNNVNVSISKSSPTWINDESGESVSKNDVQNAINKLKILQAHNFGAGTEIDEDTKLDKPYLTITVKEEDGMYVAKIGGPAPKELKNDPERRYAVLEGRDAYLLIAEKSIQDLIDTVKNTSK